MSTIVPPPQDMQDGNGYRPPCPNCGAEPSGATREFVNRGLVAAYYICANRHGWSVSWLAVA